MGFTTSGSLEFAACFKERKEAGNRTTAVRFIQAHARNGARLRNPYADRPMRWLGFSHGAMRGCISSPTGIATSSCKAPSALFQGCIPETNARFFARDYEILTLFARFLAKSRCGFPQYHSSEFVTTCLPIWRSISVKVSMMLRSAVDSATEAHIYVLVRSNQTWFSQQLTCSLNSKDARQQGRFRDGQPHILPSFAQMLLEPCLPNAQLIRHFSCDSRGQFHHS